jgi:asparagine synthase (glutamine-hydrolysing)
VAAADAESPAVIAGLVRWNAPAEDRAWLDAVARRHPDAALVATPDPLWALATPGVRVERAPDVTVIADVDLTNLDDLERLARGRERRHLLCALYELEGPRFVRRLRGSFALALWDARARRLVLAVDHFGIRRLYHARAAGLTAFADRPGALRGLPGLAGAVAPAAVYDYLNFGFVPAPASIYRGIERLAPGHLTVVGENRTETEAYWDLRYDERPLARADAARAVYRATEQAVAAALRGTAPKETGAYLSGGTDSSTVVGLAQRLTGERPNAFSIGFYEEPYDELAYAELAARHFGAAHYVRKVEPAEALSAVSVLVDAYDEPFGNNSAIGTYFCARLAADCGVSLLLAGDGGDEIFGGNERYRTDRLYAAYHRIPAVVRRGLLEPVLRAFPDGGLSLLGKAQRYVHRANVPNPRRFYSWEFFFAQDGAALLAPDFLASVERQSPYTVVLRHWARAAALAELNRLLYLDLKLTIGDNDLLKVTRTAELTGVGVRFPLLDVTLVELTASLPARFKVRGLEKRYLFKRAFRDLLPGAILTKRKHGFGVPTSLWLRHHPGFRDLARDTLLAPDAWVRAYFSGDGLRRLFALHAADPTPYYGDQLWRVLMLELWARRHLRGGSGP